jgi:thioredoxin reductase
LEQREPVVTHLPGQFAGELAQLSARIENYLGFPTGISGMALMARSAGGARPMMLRAPLANTAAAKNLIPLPTENTPSLRSFLRIHL